MFLLSDSGYPALAAEFCNSQGSMIVVFMNSDALTEEPLEQATPSWSKGCLDGKIPPSPDQ